MTKNSTFQMVFWLMTNNYVTLLYIHVLEFTVCSRELNFMTLVSSSPEQTVKD